MPEPSRSNSTNNGTHLLLVAPIYVWSLLQTSKQFIDVAVHQQPALYNLALFFFFHHHKQLDLVLMCLAAVGHIRSLLAKRQALWIIDFYFF